MRYTEARMTKISEELLRDIEKDTVNFVQTMMILSQNQMFSLLEFQINF